MPKMVICLNLDISKLHCGWLLASHLLPVIGVGVVYPFVSLFIAPLALILAYFHISHLYSPKRIARLQEMPDKNHGGKLWLLTSADGGERSAWLFRSGMFGCYWIRLQFLDKQGRSYFVWIFPDSLDQESRRQLRLKLRHG